MQETQPTQFPTPEQIKKNYVLELFQTTSRYHLEALNYLQEKKIMGVEHTGKENLVATYAACVIELYRILRPEILAHLRRTGGEFNSLQEIKEKEKQIIQGIQESEEDTFFFFSEKEEQLREIATDMGY